MQVWSHDRGFLEWQTMASERRRPFLFSHAQAAWLIGRTWMATQRHRKPFEMANRAEVAKMSRNSPANQRGRSQLVYRGLICLQVTTWRGGSAFLCGHSCQTWSQLCQVNRTAYFPLRKCSCVKEQLKARKGDTQCQLKVWSTNVSLKRKGFLTH